jgi:hypothetical protein
LNVNGWKHTTMTPLCCFVPLITIQLLQDCDLAPMCVTCFLLHCCLVLFVIVWLLLLLLVNLLLPPPILCKFGSELRSTIELFFQVCLSNYACNFMFLYLNVNGWKHTMMTPFGAFLSPIYSIYNIIVSKAWYIQFWVSILAFGPYNNVFTKLMLCIIIF